MRVFFFQAEDGIRDRDVTGVQTCALPISYQRRSGGADSGSSTRRIGAGTYGEAHSKRTPSFPRLSSHLAERPVRSEERRVGKECRGRWGQYHLKKQSERHRTKLRWTVWRR